MWEINCCFLDPFITAKFVLNAFTAVSVITNRCVCQARSVCPKYFLIGVFIEKYFFKSLFQTLARNGEAIKHIG